MPAQDTTAKSLTVATCRVVRTADCPSQHSRAATASEVDTMYGPAGQKHSLLVSSSQFRGQVLRCSDATTKASSRQRRVDDSPIKAKQAQIPPQQAKGEKLLLQTTAQGSKLMKKRLRQLEAVQYQRHGATRHGQNPAALATSSKNWSAMLDLNRQTAGDAPSEQGRACAVSRRLERKGRSS